MTWIKSFNLIIITNEVEMNLKKINIITQWKEFCYIENI